MTIASAELKFLGELYYITSTTSYESCMDSLARSCDLKVAPISSDIEVTEDSDLSGPEFRRFSTSIGGFCYTRIIETMFKENNMWCFLDDAGNVYSLGNADIEYLKEYYADETAEIFGTKKPEANKPKAQNQPQQAPQQQTSKPAVVNDTKGLADPLRGIPALAFNPIPDVPLTPVTAARPIVPTVSMPEPKAGGIKARTNPDGSINLSISTEPPKGGPVITPKIPVPEGTVPVDVKARLDSIIAKNASNALIYQNFPWVKELETKLSGNGSFVVETDSSAGIVRMDVSTPEGKKMDQYSITIDPAGSVVTKYPKWWPGTSKDIPIDFRNAYKYSDKAIATYIAGEKIPDSEVSYNDKVAKLNRLVDLRSIFDVAKTDEEALAVLSNISKTLENKKIMDQITKDCHGYRFTIGKYADRDNFEIFSPKGVYSYIGGPLADNAVEVKVCIAKNRAPKIITK